MFFRLRTNPRIPIKNSTSDKFIVVVLLSNQFSLLCIDVNHMEKIEVIRDEQNTYPLPVKIKGEDLSDYRYLHHLSVAETS